MVLKSRVITLTVALAALGVAITASGRPGNGNINCSQPVIKVGQSFKFGYAVTESDGTGTADLRCTVTGPDDVAHRARKMPEWRNGVGGSLTIATFFYPSEFSGGSTAKPGLYNVDCVSYVEGQGDCARATATLTVE